MVVRLGEVSSSAFKLDLGREVPGTQKWGKWLCQEEGIQGIKEQKNTRQLCGDIRFPESTCAERCCRRGFAVKQWRCQSCVFVLCYRRGGAGCRETTRRSTRMCAVSNRTHPTTPPHLSSACHSSDEASIPASSFLNSVVGNSGPKSGLSSPPAQLSKLFSSF